jgi:hypothetical protein
LPHHWLHRGEILFETSSKGSYLLYIKN